MKIDIKRKNAYLSKRFYFKENNVNTAQSKITFQGDVINNSSTDRWNECLDNVLISESLSALDQFPQR